MHKVQEILTIEPGECKIAKELRTVTRNRMAAKFEVPMSGDIRVEFEDPVDVQAFKEVGLPLRDGSASTDWSIPVETVLQKAMVSPTRLLSPLTP